MRYSLMSPPQVACRWIGSAKPIHSDISARRRSLSERAMWAMLVVKSDVLLEQGGARNWRAFQ